MRQVKVFDRKWNAEKRESYVVEKCYATFHQFGVDYEEFESGPANYSVAIVEYSDGKVDLIPANLIQFVDGGTL